MLLTEDEVCEGFRARLAKVAKERGYTPTKIAKGLRETGRQISTVTVRKWFSDGGISEPNLLALSALLGTTPWELRYGVSPDGMKDATLATLTAHNTARRAAIAEITRSHEQLETVCKLLHAAFWEYDLLTTQMMVSGDIEAIFGSTLNDLGLGEPDDLLQFINPEDRPLFTKAWTDALNGRPTHNQAIRIKWHAFDPGRSVRTWICPQASKEGRSTTIIGVLALEESQIETER